MSNQALTKALHAVRATVRMKILLARHSVKVDDLLLDEPPAASVEDGALAEPLLGDKTASFAKLSAAYKTVKAARAGSAGLVTETEAAIASHWFLNDVKALGSLVTASWVNLLLLMVPVALASGYLGWGSVPTFVLNLLALIPLALILGDVTEDLAMHYGSIVGGLLNATFGNIVELILCIAALQRGLYTVVATSLIGSILSNMLLVLGCCFLFGGYYFKTQNFNAMSNRACSSLLLLSSIGIAIPTAAGHLMSSGGADTSTMLIYISRGTAIVLLLCYLCYLYFQLFTHAHLFEEPAGEDDCDEPLLSTTAAATALAAISVLVAVHSEFLTGSIEEVSKSTGLSQAFMGMIILPIAGNACEHMAAVVVAMKNKMELSLGIAIGSSLQIALCVLPVVVLVGWATGHDMTLNFDLFAVVALLLSVVHANFVTADANSHWLMGVSLIAVYLLITIAYVFQGDAEQGGEGAGGR